MSQTERYLLGAFQGETLIGILSFRRWEGLKVRHRVSIGGMYVPPESRGSIGKTLLEKDIGRAGAIPGVGDLISAVTVGNEQTWSLGAWQSLTYALRRSFRSRIAAAPHKRFMALCPCTRCRHCGSLLREFQQAR